MLGRLARYLRFVGHDTAYARGLGHAEIAERAALERRTIVTRCRALAASVPGSVLLSSLEVDDQLRAVRSAAPTAGFAVTFDRCTLCNGVLAAWTPPRTGPWPPDVPRGRAEAGLEVYACLDCGHRFWEGSHTRAIRAQLSGWLA